MSCNQHLRRWGASLMAWILVLSMCAGLVFPAYATAPTDATETTQVTEATDATETTGTTGTTEVTQATDTTEVTEVTEATEATESTESTESTETTEVTESEDLTAEEQAQAEAVLTALNALESADQVEAKLAALEEDPEGYAAYYNQALAATQAVRDAYAALTDAQKELVGDITKLNDLDWLVPREFLPDDSNQGSIWDSLDGDWAYITDLMMKPDSTTESKAFIRTGSAPWDNDDAPGNDSSELNNIVRTFDTVSYTIQFNTKLREAVARDDCGGIEKGRLYFEFIIRGTSKEIIFDTGSMGWLENYEDICYELVSAELNGVPCQVLRGSFTLTPTGANDSAIGASTNELSVVVRVLQMKNGDTVAPTFTLWLNHNEVGCTYDTEDDRLPETTVTGLNHICNAQVTIPNTDPAQTEVHDNCEAATVTAPEITVSARSMFNLAVTGVHFNNTKVGSYDFGDEEIKYINSDNEEATVINSGIGTVYGRLNGYGLRLELRGKEGQGMRGAEFPDENTPITFQLASSTTFQPAGGSETDEEAYYPLFWSGGPNAEDYSNSSNYRPVTTSSHYSPDIPANRRVRNTDYNRCSNGGTWTFEKGNDGNIEVTISGFAFDTDHFPYTSYNGNHLSYTYYIPPTDTVNGIKNYWDITQAVFSCGVVWFVQPYQAVSGNNIGQFITDKYNTQAGTFHTCITAENLSMKTISGSEATENYLDDNEKNRGQYLSKPGRIETALMYMRGGTRIWNDALTVGALTEDYDWATPGSEVSIRAGIGHYEAEGDLVGAAYDLLLKFDDAFFIPNGVTAGSSAKVLWAALPADNTTDTIPDGWTDDEHMKRATVDDLVYYTDLDTLYGAGKVPVGVLLEVRGVSQQTGSVGFAVYIDGKVAENCAVNQVYMITQNSFAWHKRDVAEDALAYYNEQHPDSPYDSVYQLTDDDYNNYAQNRFPSRDPSRGTSTVNLYTQDYATAGGEGTSYPVPFYRQDYYFTSNHGDIDPNGTINSTAQSELKQASKATYTDGVYKSGYGSYYYQDSCLVIPYVTSVTKSVAQTEASGNSKEFYDVSRNQRTVDYVINANISRHSGEGTSTGAAIDTIIYIEDILPASLQYLPGSAYLGGNYTQNPLHQNPGTCDGTPFMTTTSVDLRLPTEEYPCLMEVTSQDDGTTRILFMFLVHADVNLDYWEQPIYFSCKIGTPGEEETDVTHGQQIINTVSIWGTEERLRSRIAAFGNLHTCGITIQKTTAVSLSKISDMLVAELTDDLGFTMNVGNNSAMPKIGTLIAETLPFLNLYSSVFNGPLVVKNFSAAVLDSNGAPITSNFQFYYTTDDAYAGWLSDDFAAQAAQEGKTLAEWLTGDAWQPLFFEDTTTEVNGLELYPASNLPTVTGTYEDGTPKQITAIVALGDLPPNATMKLHITLNLPKGLRGDLLMNYLSQEALSSYALSQIVLRTLEGLAWLDTDKDGIQDSDENKLSGVKVTLKRLEGNSYVPVCYPGTQTPITIETGQVISVNAASAAEAAPYEEGRYKFTELPTGTYAVFFESGTTSIEGYTASPINVGDDDALDSDGAGAYSGAALLHTEITGIKMSPVTEVPRSGIQVSKHHDSGFYPTAYYELPLTGGMGTGGFTVIGLLLTAAAVLGLAPRKKKKH